VNLLKYLLFIIFLVILLTGCAGVPDNQADFVQTSNSIITNTPSVGTGDIEPLTFTSIEGLKAAKEEVSETYAEYNLKELEYFYIPDELLSLSKAYLSCIYIKDRYVALYYNLTDDDSDKENKKHKVNPDVIFEWIRNEDGELLLSNRVKSQKVKQIGESSCYYKDTILSNTRSIHWSDDGYCFMLNIPIKLYDKLFIKYGSSEISEENLDKLTSISKVNVN
jgi:hypothetical protein